MSLEPLDHDHLLAEGRALRRLALSLLGGAARGVADYEDLVQEAHLAALKDRDVVRSGGWLAGTVRNLAKMLQRGAVRQKRREQVVAGSREAADPAAIAMQAEVLRDTAAAVQCLEEPFRTAIVLRYWQGLSPTQIAAQLAVPLDTVRSRLQRGLERLRARLDARHGSRSGWASPLLVFGPGRQAAVIPLVQGAGAGTGAGMTLLTFGVLMHSKMFAGAVVALVLAAVWLGWPAPLVGSEQARAESRANAAAVTAQVATSEREGTASEPQREAVAVAEVPSDFANEGPFDPSLVAVAPWSPILLVVDGEDMPVPGATITIWPGAKVERSPEVRRKYGGPRHAYQGREQQSRWTVVTDADGMARPVLDLENVVVMASMPGLLPSREDVLWHQIRVPTKLTLQRDLKARGIVLDVDGSPAAGVVVTAGVSEDDGRVAGVCAPSTTDAAGRFELLVPAHTTGVFRGQRGDSVTFYRRLRMREDRTDIVLQFPGAITLRGRVVDAHGAPVAESEVKVWREPQRASEPEEDIEQMVSITADARGAFEVPVRSLAPYQLLARAAGHATSAPVFAQTSASDPHPEVLLTLAELVPIEGTVVRADGSAFPRVNVRAEAELLARGGSFAPGREELFDAVGWVKTDAEGRFRLGVHPGTKWTLHVMPNARAPRLVKLLSGVEPGTMDARIQLAEEDLKGCIVRGTVVRADDGSQVPAFGMEIVSYGENELRGGGGVRIHGSHFECEPLPIGRRFGLVIDPSGALGSSETDLSMAVVQPFVTSGAEIELEVRLPRLGELPVRVLGPGDAPIRNASVVANEKDGRRSRRWRHVDGLGRVRLPGLSVGENYVMVWRANELVHRAEMTILPGENPEVVVRLPR
jgi:RNA polymerase sigma factor (sigma-70 family)